MFLFLVLCYNTATGWQPICSWINIIIIIIIQYIYVFCVDLRTNSDYFTVQHWLVGFYNWDGVCLLRRTFYILRSATQCIYVFCVDLRPNSDYFTVQHWLTVFITETECVYCVERTEIVSTILAHFRLQAHYWFPTDFVCSSISRTLEWTPPNFQFTVPSLPPTCVIPIQIIQFSEQSVHSQHSSRRNFMLQNIYKSIFRYNF